MSDHLKPLVDLDDEHLAEVPLGRNRILRALGVALFGIVVRMTMPQTANAWHGLEPCYGPVFCTCCGDGGSCCASNCNQTSAYCQPFGGYVCWYTCSYNLLFICCDYLENSNHCMCMDLVGSC